jgi:hypothetical protein
LLDAEEIITASASLVGYHKQLVAYMAASVAATICGLDGDFDWRR